MNSTIPLSITPSLLQLLTNLKRWSSKNFSDRRAAQRRNFLSRRELVISSVSWLRDGEQKASAASI
jgi:hypothetical protein